MNAHRLGAGVAIGLLGFTLTTGVAAANHEGTPHYPLGEVDDSQALGETETRTEVSPTLAFTDDAPATGGAAGGSLPFTGGDVAGMTLVGAAAVGIGAVMIRRSKASAETTA